MKIEIYRSKGCLWISQEGYLGKILSNFRMDQCNSVATLVGAHFKLKTTTKHEIREHADQMEGITYQSVVGSIMYVMIGTRPDLAYKAGLVSRFTCNPIQEHWRAVKWVLRYIQGSLDTKLCYKRKGEFIVKGYCKSQLQQVVILSTAEA